MTARQELFHNHPPQELQRQFLIVNRAPVLMLFDPLGQRIPDSATAREIGFLFFYNLAIDFPPEGIPVNFRLEQKLILPEKERLPAVNNQPDHDPFPELRLVLGTGNRDLAILQPAFIRRVDRTGILANYHTVFGLVPVHPDLPNPGIFFSNPKKPGYCHPIHRDPRHNRFRHPHISVIGLEDDGSLLISFVEINK